MDPLFTAGLCVISFCRASIFLHQKKALRPSIGFTRQFHWWLLEGRWLEHVSFFKGWFNPSLYNQHISPTSRPFLSRFVFRTSRLVRYVTGISLEVLWCFSPWKPRGSNCWCSSRSCQSPSELCGTTERCSVDVEEAGTIFVLCPLECWSLIRGVKGSWNSTHTRFTD